MEDNDSFINSPRIKENSDLLHEIGVLAHIEALERYIYNYKKLLIRGFNIFNHTTIDEIMDATVRQISEQFLPSFIAFIWKPIQTRENIAMKAYKDFEPIEIDLNIDCITPFEAFFKQYPKPIQFELLAYQIDNDEAVKPYLDINTEIAVPILGPFGLYGIILVGKKTLEEGYSYDELFFLQQLLAFVSQAIKNYLHYDHSLHDVKTGLYNHGFFMTRLNEEVTRTKRGDYHSSIIVLDVDKFKNFNDSYGHLAGDRVLEHIAQMIRSCVRADDIPSRFGGEEFTVLLPNTNNNTVWNVAERLRNSVAKMHVPWDVPLSQVTISLGIYTFDGKSDIDVPDIIRRADEALYVSKKSGRNRSTAWSPEMSNPHSTEESSTETTNNTLPEAS
ncbi:MAG: sensor domain-containing diguanylate cyclase [Treponema sp.]|jgi:diguanylate cyclase (GGDEF)-like protein|nr:sensor domain-containing diguanylate cyclase [Treponema sp.]